MIDWIRDHAWASWLGLAVVLAVVEMLSLDLVLLMFAIGALAAAAAAGLGAPIWITLPLFAVVSLLLLFLVRP
ncbi:MAG: NfeD family protein, partial [Aeromicrobium sp.]